MKIDFDRLRSDLLAELLAAYFGGGIGSALVDHARVEVCPDEELISIARRYGFPIENYIVNSNGHHPHR